MNAPRLDLRFVLLTPYGLSLLTISTPDEYERATRITLVAFLLAANERRVDDESYPLVRALFTYTTAEIVNSKPQVKDFINFYLRSVNDYISDVGYFAAKEADFQDTVRVFVDAISD